MPLYPQELNRRITIEKLSSTQNPTTGDMIESWVTHASVWAKKLDSSASEFNRSQAMQSEIKGLFKIRYRSDVDATMRIKHKGKLYNIEGVLEDNESGQEWLTLPYSEGVNDGS